MKSIKQVKKLISEGEIKVTPLLKENAIVAMERRPISDFITEARFPLSDDEGIKKAQRCKDSLKEKIGTLSVDLDLK